MTRYQHRQSATLLLCAFAIATFILLLASARTSMGYPGLIAVAALVLAGALFSSLSIQVSEEFLSWKFGPGPISKKVLLSEIVGVETTRTKWWEGWGIRLTRRGWLYNVSGLDAVLIRLKSGKQFLLGTDEPIRLMRVLQTVISENE